MTIRSTDNHLLKTCRGGGPVLFLFVPLCGVGLAALAQWLGLTHFSFIPDAEQGPLLMVGLAFTLLGGGVILFREGAVIDRRRGTVTVWWGLLVPMNRKEYPLQGIEFVSLIKHLDYSKHGRPLGTHYRVYLAGPCSVRVDEFGSPEKARIEGMRVAGFLGLPLQDHTEGNGPPSRVGGHPSPASTETPAKT